MSPEQWSDAQAVGPASDVYSLGVVAYEVLTGRLPYTTDNSEEFYRLHRFAELPRLGDRFPPDLDRVIGCALAKLPEHRYRSPLEMAAELREALQAQPRERLRSLARVWKDSARSPVLLLRGGELLHTPTETVGELERAFVTASHRRSARVAWLRRCLAASAVACVVGAVWYRGVMETRAARNVTEATAAQAELEAYVERGEGWLADHPGLDVLTTDMQIVRNGRRHRMFRSVIPSSWRALLAANST